MSLDRPVVEEPQNLLEIGFELGKGLLTGLLFATLRDHDVEGLLTTPGHG